MKQKKLNKIGKILLDYYWLNRRFRLSRIYRTLGIKSKEIEEFISKKDISKDEINRIIVMLVLMKTEIAYKINEYVNELYKMIKELNNGEH